MIEIGDKVLSKSDDWTNGLIGVVVKKFPDESHAAVQFEGHNLGWGENMDCWYIPYNELWAQEGH